MLTSGYLVVKRFEVLYREFARDSRFTLPIYALPLFGRDPTEVAVRYQGLDRNPVMNSKYGSLADLRMRELDPSDEHAGFLCSFEDAADVLGWAEYESPNDFEIIWTRIAGTLDEPPKRFEPLGYEPTYFPGHFSALCDCMCFPRWHGTDPEGTLFRRYFEQLNANGLFNTAELAAEFLAYYLSFDWTETGEYEIAEVWAPSK